MTPTPRTEARVWTPYSGQQDVVWASFASELERENAELRKDKARLDWLEQRIKDEPLLLHNCHDSSEWPRWPLGLGLTPWEPRSLRAAIDAAQQEANK
jgi:hypothetical protein